MSAPEQIAYGSARGRWVLTAAVLGSGVALLDGTVVNIALPILGEDLGAGFGGLQWTVNGYTLTLAALILLGGSLGDRFGRRKVFLVGVVWFAAASALCGLAINIEMLVASRLLQGIGGALLTPGSLALIAATFEKGDRARAIGAWSGLGAIAGVIGPFVGGLLVEVSWRLVFLVNLPVAALIVVLTLKHVPESRDEQMDPRLDVLGAVVGAFGLAAVTYGLIGAGDGGLAARELASLVVGVLLLVVFVENERRSDHPMLPVGIFSNRQFTAANLVTFTVYAALGAVFFLLVLQLQVVAGFSPLVAGSALLPVTAAMLLLSARAGALAQRIGPRLPMSLGPILAAGGILLLSRVGERASYVAGVLPGAVVFGLGLALTVAPLTATVLAAASRRHSGVASGVNNAVARTAQLLAVAVLPLIAGISGDDYSDPGAFDGGFRTAMRIAAGLLVAGGLLAAATIRNDTLEPAPAGPAGPAFNGPPPP